MKIALATALSLAVLPLSGDVPQYTIEVDDIAPSSWTITTERDTTSAVMTVMDNEHDSTSGTATIAVRTMELSDEFGKVSDDGSPVTITRSYETLLSETGHESNDLSGAAEYESELVGQTVIFTYDADAEEWSAEYDETSEGKETWLENLKPRIDLVDCLGESDEGPEVGNSWELDPCILDEILRPGGLLFVTEEVERKAPAVGSFSITHPNGDWIQRYDEFEGEVLATYEEIVEEDGSRHARILIEVDVEADLDVVEDLNDMMGHGKMELTHAGGSLLRSLAGDLTLLWDLDGHRAVSIEGELIGVEELSAEWTIEIGDPGIEITFSHAVDVTHTIEAAFGD